jgi:phosphoribosylamine-glycine ligase
VLAITALAPTLAQAQLDSARYATKVRFEGRQFRRDIGWRELARNAGTS